MGRQVSETVFCRDGFFICQGPYKFDWLAAHQMFHNSGNNEEEALTGDPEFIEEGDNLDEEEKSGLAETAGVDDGLMQWSNSLNSEPKFLDTAIQI